VQLTLTRVTLGVTFRLVTPFSELSMIQMVTVPSGLRGKLDVVFEPIDVFVPLLKPGLPSPEPRNSGTVFAQSLWSSTEVGTNAGAGADDDADDAAGWLVGPDAPAADDDGDDGDDVPPWPEPIGGMMQLAARRRGRMESARAVFTMGTISRTCHDHAL
jgi:hypothetical protein